MLQGTREQSVAEAQAMALTELVAHTATARDTEPAPSCSPVMTIPLSRAVSRCGSCMSGAGHLVSACKSRPLPVARGYG